MTRTTVLVVEDDSAIRRGLVDALVFAGYTVLEAADGRQAVELGIESEVDLVLLDVRLPQVDGFEVLSAIRAARPALPIIMVTARGAEEDRVRGLREGADDYVIKPFSATELMARVEAVLRRSAERPGDVHLILSDRIRIDLDRREVHLPESEGEPVALSEREAAILRYLAANRGRAIDRGELLHRVWGLDPRNLETRTVDMQIRRLRAKLGEDGTEHGLIVTVRSKGYMLADSIRVEER